jgi:uncharacterized protein (DUF1684 family)
VTDEYLASVEAVRAARIARLRSATGWLSLVGKAFLGEGVTVVGSSPDAGARLPGGPAIVGRLHVEKREAGHEVRFEVEDGVVVTCGGERVHSRVLRSDKAGRADALVCEGFVLELMERGDALALRIRDTRVLPAPFAGIDVFSVDQAWVLRARLEAYPEPREVDVDYEGAIGTIADRLVSPGRVAFEHLDEVHRLEAVYEDSSRRRLFILFRDATSGPESYGLGRFVYAPLPDGGGAVTLDFNLAMLPGCAFTVFATCPIPPRANRLSFHVRAGERNYRAPAIGE